MEDLDGESCKYEMLNIPHCNLSMLPICQLLVSFLRAVEVEYNGDESPRTRKAALTSKIAQSVRPNKRTVDSLHKAQKLRIMV